MDSAGYGSEVLDHGGTDIQTGGCSAALPAARLPGQSRYLDIKVVRLRRMGVKVHGKELVWWE